MSEELCGSWMHYSLKPPLEVQAWMLTGYPLGVSPLPPLNCAMLMTGRWASLAICYTIFKILPLKVVSTVGKAEEMGPEMGPICNPQQLSPTCRPESPI